MESDRRTILRIRCNRELLRRFKKVAADYEDYEEALEAVITLYEQRPKVFRGQTGKYVVRA